VLLVEEDLEDLEEDLEKDPETEPFNSQKCLSVVCLWVPFYLAVSSPALVQRLEDKLLRTAENCEESGTCKRNGFPLHSSCANIVM